MNQKELEQGLDRIRREESGQAIDRRNMALEALAALGYDKETLDREMADACSDAPRLARHARECDWAERKLASARENATAPAASSPRI